MTRSAPGASGRGCSAPLSTARAEDEGDGWQTHEPAPAFGVHARGRGPGDSFSLPYFAVDDLEGALERVKALGGTVIHPGDRWAICKDSEGSPFGLAVADAIRGHGRICLTKAA